MSTVPVFTVQDVEEILRLVDRLSDIEIRLESGDLTFCMRKSSVRNSSIPAEPPLDVPCREASPPAPLEQLQETRPEKVEIEVGTAVIRAFMVGTFYRAPSSTEPPFVEVGTRVGAEDPVCLIEVMKLFTTMKAGVAGQIVSIEAKNGMIVEEGDVLFVVQVD